MKLDFPILEPPPWVPYKDWSSPLWQYRQALKTKEDFQKYFDLTSDEEQAFVGSEDLFRIRVTPYYAQLARQSEAIKKTLVPTVQELQLGEQQMPDPLGERKNNPAPRIVHRYPDRVLFLVTDFCSVYCRYCLRKYFTGNDQVLIKKDEYTQALNYIKQHTEIREVILSGGDPLTLGDNQLLQIIEDLREIDHVELIRIGSRIPVVNPMRITEDLVKALKVHHPIYMMVHYNHPKELTGQAAQALSLLVDNGFPVFNQMVLLRGVNNHPAVVQALSRRLLKLRVKPYYMFQADPSEGTDHFRTSVAESKEIQRQLWGKLSGLAMPNLSLDIPGGGGKVGIVPDFLQEDQGDALIYKGWDGIEGIYKEPKSQLELPKDWQDYKTEWQSLNQKTIGSL